MGKTARRRGDRERSWQQLVQDQRRGGSAMGRMMPPKRKADRMLKDMTGAKYERRESADQSDCGAVS